MTRIFLIGAFAILSFCFTGCDFLDDDVVRFEIISEGSFSGINTKTETVVDSQSQWTTLWDQHVSIQVPKPALPSVDFSSSVVVAIVAGNKPDSCYNLFLREVSEDGDNVNIRYEIVTSPPDLGCADVITQPFTIFRIPRPEGSISIQEAGSR